MDPRLENQYSESAARRISKLADSCLSKSPKARPRMSEVVETLKQIIHSCSENSPSVDSFQCAAEDPIDDDQEPEQKGPTESQKRRMAHLAKLSERVGGLSRKGFMIMQRAKVT